MPNRSEARVEIGTYKGHPTITLFADGDNRGFCFGLAKAKKVLANFEAIKKFVELNLSKEEKASLEVEKNTAEWQKHNSDN